ncbi:hypothetical protein BST85_07775 [Aureitalea marina]|uniref:Uncharacterized protein n=1 Tax=Aureitalea marina TaxID=930804 RepID=A0A2S7KQE3_9FLAO|nr:hypothetical protein BST85_07775 [Aureitalea marina]
MVKNRHTRTVTSEDPTRFYLQLTNHSDQVQEYLLSVDVGPDSCSLGDLESERRTDPDLFTTTWKTSQNSANRVLVQPGQSESISMLVSLRQTLSRASWQCITVKAQSKQCSSNSHINLRLWMEPDQSDN